MVVRMYECMMGLYLVAVSICLGLGIKNFIDRDIELGILNIILALMVLIFYIVCR